MNINPSKISDFFATQASKASETIKQVDSGKIQQLGRETLGKLKETATDAKRGLSNLVTLTRYGSQETKEKVQNFSQEQFPSAKEAAKPFKPEVVKQRASQIRKNIIDFFPETKSAAPKQSKCRVEVDPKPFAEGGFSTVHRAKVTMEESGETIDAVSVVSNDKAGTALAYDPVEVRHAVDEVSGFLGDRMPVIYEVSTTVKKVHDESQECPQVVMEPLTKFPEELPNNRKIAVTNNFIEITKLMNQNGWVHQDLAHSNIMCRNDQPSRLALIDVTDLREIESFVHNDARETLKEIRRYNSGTAANNPPDINSKLDPLKQRAKELNEMEEAKVIIDLNGIKSGDEDNLQQLVDNKQLTDYEMRKIKGAIKKFGFETCQKFQIEKYQDEIAAMGRELKTLVQEKESFNAACTAYCLWFDGDAVEMGENGKVVPQIKDLQKGGGLYKAKPDLDKVKENIDADPKIPEGIRQYMLEGFGLAN